LRGHTGEFRLLNFNYISNSRYIFLNKKVICLLNKYVECTCRVPGPTHSCELGPIHPESNLLFEIANKAVTSYQEVN
jgi:hypothetical protein